ncbi:hypothetical protein K466DRAFT_606864 [Polyporus arcularius HHB13444]|uniref:Uncharacterized protein n=1 Tax=Polyporus arcularius HHB13444 TaxID=1314778 RepID=A0A5C3NM44_9APHY|nr:hypothetical protein K466DRAFT_606864 [Polyporus arcularius HHB13444]
MHRFWNLDHEPDVYEASDFTANDYADAYTEHICVLSAIKQKDLRAYHSLMHGLYIRVCGLKATPLRATPTSVML